MLKFNGKWIKLPWDDWSAFEISPEGIRTHQGTISIESIRLAIWRLNSVRGRSYMMMQDHEGGEMRLEL